MQIMCESLSHLGSFSYFSAYVCLSVYIRLLLFVLAEWESNNFFSKVLFLICFIISYKFTVTSKNMLWNLCRNEEPVYPISKVMQFFTQYKVRSCKFSLNIRSGHANFHSKIRSCYAIFHSIRSGQAIS